MLHYIKFSVVQLVNWVPPNDENQVALDVDGSSLGNPGHAGFGGLIRDHNGSWILGFSEYIGVVDSVEAELKGIEIGLGLAWERGYRDVICRSDCWKAIFLSLDSTSQPHEYVKITDSIKELMSREWIVSLKWTHRVSNQCADILAKWGAYQCADYMAEMGGKPVDGRTMFSKPPPCLSSLLSSDAKRTRYETA